MYYNTAHQLLKEQISIFSNLHTIFWYEWVLLYIKYKFTYDTNTTCSINMKSHLKHDVIFLTRSYKKCIESIIKCCTLSTYYIVYICTIWFYTNKLTNYNFCNFIKTCKITVKMWHILCTSFWAFGFNLHFVFFFT